MTHFVPPQSVLVLLQDTLSTLYAVYDLYMLLIFSKYFHFNWLSSNCKRGKKNEKICNRESESKSGYTDMSIFSLFFQSSNSFYLIASEGLRSMFLYVRYAKQELTSTILKL